MLADLPIVAERFLLAYLVQSTLWLAGAWLVLRLARGLGGEVRSLVWKMAVVAGILGATAVSLLPVPHAGPRLVVSPAAGDHRPSVEARRGEPGITAIPEAVVVGDAGRPAEATSNSTSVPSGREASSITGSPMFDRGTASWLALVAWVSVAALMFARLAIDAIRLERLRRRSPLVTEGRLAAWTARLAERLGLRIELRRASEPVSPLAAGVFRPVILVPGELLDQLAPAELAGLVAHELAHVERRDPLWRLVTAVACGLFWFQPLNWLARRRLAIEAEYLADRRAVEWLRNPVGLARCLASVLEWQLAARRTTAASAITVGIVGRRSTLVDRVHALLESPHRPARGRVTTRLLLCVAVLAVPLLAPRAADDAARPTRHPRGDDPMLATLTAITLAAGLAAADDPAPAKPAPTAPAARAEETAMPKVVPVPVSVRGFSGQIVGRVVSTDVEKGDLVLSVQVVNRVWKNSTAEQPKDLEQKTVAVAGVFGKWLDVLLVVKPGDTVELEARHVEGEKLKFLGENFRKVEPVAAVRGLPREDGARGEEPADGFPAGLRGFRGILLGKVVSKDVEKGTLVVEMTGVKRTWPQNKATDPASAKGTKLTVNGIAGKWLDVLLSFDEGELIEVEAFHNRGASLDFVHEWLRKAETPKAE